MKVNLLFRNATVVDGSGGPSIVADVAVTDGRVVAMGNLKAMTGSVTVDCEGLVLSPGFIDVHTHSDFALTVYPRAESMTSQGVTTQVVGNCGFSPFPVVKEHEAALREYTDFLDAGLPWGSWTSAKQFFDLLDGLPLASNIVSQVGHGSVRIAAMGFSVDMPTDEERKLMAGFVRDAMLEGAVGMSSGLTYAPSSAATTDELVSLAKIVSSFGGIYSTHIRSEAIRLVEAVEEALAIGAQANLPVQLSHHKAMGTANWSKVSTTLQMIDSAVATGQDVTLDQYPYTAGSTGLAIILPRRVLEGGAQVMRERLRDPVVRATVREEISAQRSEDLLAGLREFDPDRIVIADVPAGPLEEYVGLTVAEVALRRGYEPIDAALDLLIESGENILTIVHGQSEENLRKIMRHERTMIASDGWTLDPRAGGKPHPRSFGTYTRVLGRYVREEGVLGIEDAVRKMTSLPASRFGLVGRGLVEVGFLADLVLFDPVAVIDVATFEEPTRFSIGVKMVVVNGKIVFENDQDTGIAAGRLLRRGRDAGMDVSKVPLHGRPVLGEL